MASHERNNVVVTGFGAVTPFGIGVPALEHGLFSGKAAIRSITGFDASRLPVRIAGEVPDFRASDHISRASARRMERFAQFAVAASREAFVHSGLENPSIDKSRCAAVIHTGAGGIPALIEATQVMRARGSAAAPPLVIARFAPNMASAHVAIELGFTGPALTGTGACASGTLGLIEAMHLVQRGEVDVAIAGGAEACVTELGIVGFDNLGVLSHLNNDPERANRPFSIDRDGTVLSEGAVVMTLESEQHAARRNAQVYARVAGGAVTSDAWHVTAPDPAGTWLARAIGLALGRAQLQPADIDLVSMHATASIAGDLAEAAALHVAFGSRGSSVPVTATKSGTGHLIGGSGALAALAVVLGFTRDEIAPTCNLIHQDPAIALNVVTSGKNRMKVHHAIANGLGFGGQNAVIVLSNPS
jgi:3-oxoacyl-[acyl-carrier-protein] synthase II